MANENPSSRLVFSGGQTKESAGAKSEAQSYLEASFSLSAMSEDLRSVRTWFEG
jgi:hypothetical protein